MSKPITLASPRYRVVLGDPEDDATWVELEAQAITRDLQMAETLFVRHKWGKAQEQPIKVTAVAAYYALRRTGQIEGSWDDFESRYLEVGEVGPPDEIPPTPPDLETD